MAGAVLLLLGTGADVIAVGPDDIDQTPAAAPAGSAGFDVATYVLAALGVGLLAVILTRGWWRLSAGPRRRLVEPVIAGSAAILLFLAPSLVVSYMPRNPTTLQDHAQAFGWAAIARGVVIVGWAVLLTRAWTRRQEPVAGQTPMGAGRSAALGAAALLVTWPIVMAVGVAAAFVMSLVGTEAEAIAHDTLRQLVEEPTTRWTWTVAALAVLVAPITEEVLYRGMIQEGLRSVPIGPWGAIIVTSVIFAAMHIGNSAPHAVAGLFVLSLGFGWAYERSGRLIAPIVMHLGFNAGNFALAMAAT